MSSQINSLRPNRATESAESATFDEPGDTEPVPPTDIVAYNELRSCADLYRLFSSGKLEIQPDFQRDVVWKQDDQTRFIDSLVKQLPIPSMCFSLDYKTQQWKVIDGLQRMTSIIKFFGNENWRLSNINDIHTSLRGVTNNAIRLGSEDQKILFSSVENMSIPITVIRCDYSKNSHMQYLFTIFHRLNSGGVRLNNQEIRNCIYSGSFNNVIKNFDSKNRNWSNVKRRIWGKTDRFRSVELVLRALAFSENLDNYKGNLAEFLNLYMHKESSAKNINEDALERKLSKMASIAEKALNPASKEKISMTFIEALLAGIVSNIEKIDLDDDTFISEALPKMLENSTFADAARYAIASESNVKNRMSVAISVLSGQQ